MCKAIELNGKTWKMSKNEKKKVKVYRYLSFKFLFFELNLNLDTELKSGSPKKHDNWETKLNKRKVEHVRMETFFDKQSSASELLMILKSSLDFHVFWDTL